MHGNKRNGRLLITGSCGRTLLKKERLARGITSAHAAKLCGLSPGHYANIENARKEMTDNILPNIENFLLDMGVDHKTKEMILK